MSNEIIKAKHKEAVEVHRKDGKVFTRVQEVGSDKTPLKTKHPFHKFIPEDKKEKYDDFLHNLREIDGKYYNKEKISAPSLGRTSYGGGEFEGLVEYDLHPSEVAYKKHLHKEKGEVKHDKKENSILAQQTIYHRGVFPTKRTDIRTNIEDAKKKSSESIHKKVNSNYAKKMKEKEQKEREKNAKEIEKTAKEQAVKTTNDRISKVNEKLSQFKIEDNTTIDDFYKQFRVDLAGLNPRGSKINVDFETKNGTKQSRNLKSLNDWIKGIISDPNTSLKQAKLPFKSIKINNLKEE